MKTRREIPNPAYWAVTRENGAQLIEPGSALHSAIISGLGEAATHDVVEVGDIFEATKFSRALVPESMGIDREAIASYPPSEDK